MKQLRCRFLCLFILTIGCAGEMNLKSTDLKEQLLENLSSDLAEVNLIVENARREYDVEPLSIRILDAWSLAKEKQLQKIGPSQGKIYTVKQKSIIEIPTLMAPVVVEVSKIQGEGEKFFGVSRPNSLGVFYAEAPVLADAGGYSIKLYDPSLELNAEAIEAIKDYVILTSRFEKTAKILFKKMLEIQEKYRDASVSIERFDIHLPLIAIDIQFKVRSM